MEDHILVILITVLNTVYSRNDPYFTAMNEHLKQILVNI